MNKANLDKIKADLVPPRSWRAIPENAFTYVRDLVNEVEHLQKENEQLKQQLHKE
jgi:hypothetical protein